MAAITLFPLQFQRQAAAPIDVDSIFTSTTARIDYLSSPRRYAGQIVTQTNACTAHILNQACDTWLSLGPSNFATPTSLGIVYGYTSSNGNTSLGYNSLGSNSSGCNNISIGRDALCGNTTGNDNIGIGQNAFSANTYGSKNIGIGDCAWAAQVSGNSNIRIGSSDGFHSWSYPFDLNHNMLSIGACADYGQQYGGCNSSFIGACTGQDTESCNATLIGFQNAGSGATLKNRIWFDDGPGTCIRAATSTITSFSDCRDKTNICSIPVGLEFVKALRPVKFEWNPRNSKKRIMTGKMEPGFIAQELDNVSQQFNADWMNLIDKSDPDKYYASIGKLLPVIIKSIQELSDRLQIINDRFN